MAITVVGGLTAATLLTLIVIPCLYRAFSPGPAGPALEADPRSRAIPRSSAAGEAAS
jgi:hypothetical protein